MRYNLADPIQLKSARNRLSYLARKERRVDLTEVRQNRTLNQNSYLHLILSAFGMHFGLDLEEAKDIYKRVNGEIYRYTKTIDGVDIPFLRSSADLNTEEMAKTIDRFMAYSAEHGNPLPPATNLEWLKQIEEEMMRSRYYARH